MHWDLRWEQAVLLVWAEQKASGEVDAMRWCQSVDRSCLLGHADVAWVLHLRHHQNPLVVDLAAVGRQSGLEADCAMKPVRDHLGLEYDMQQMNVNHGQLESHHYHFPWQGGVVCAWSAWQWSHEYVQQGAVSGHNLPASL